MHLAEVLELHHGAIETLWLEHARRAPAARGLTREEVLAFVPELLGAIAVVFRGPGEPSASWGENAVVERHLSSRLRQGFNLDDVVHEYTFLGQAVASFWSEVERPSRPSSAELEQFFLIMNKIVSTSVATFTRHLNEDEQTQKRYLRLLDKVAEVALVDRVRPLLVRFGAVTRVLAEALTVDDVWLALWDELAKTHAVAGASGFDELDPKTLLERFSSEEDRDILLDPGDLLRARGIRFATAYPLWSRGKHIGAIYVGSRTPIDSAQRRRLGALAERLAVLIDNAVLFGTSQDSVTRLENERLLREQFVAVLAHDLRGPLATAKLSASLLLEHPEKLDVRRDLALRIERNLDRADRMIRDLLDANRIRAGERLPLKLEECDLGTLAREVGTELELAYGERFDVRADYPLRGVWSAEELHRAIWNLGANAAKYSFPETRIEIVAHWRGENAEVSVHNWGPVLSKEEITAFFHPFSRAAESGGRSGWGLGLTLVRGAVEAHGGTIDVTSSPEKGTTFRIRLPFALAHTSGRAPKLAPDSHAPPEKEARAMANKLEGKKVAFLFTDGVEQVEVTGPKEALEAEGAICTIVAPKSKVKAWNHTNWGDEFDCDVPLSEAKEEDYDALVLPGGVMNPDKLRIIPEAQAFVRKFFDAGKPVGAICHGPWTLIDAGVVQGREVTSWPSLRADLTNAGADWVDAEVICDDGLVTSRKPDDIPAFSRKLVEEIREGLHGPARAKVTAGRPAAGA